MCVVFVLVDETYVRYVCILSVVYVCAKYMSDVMCNVCVWHMHGVCLVCGLAVLYVSVSV